ncbi:MAG: DUF421 domain-containing protein [Bacteroidales bacterium]|nr:DUF421 domain-containing protein [Bacteroidales bacterium]
MEWNEVLLGDESLAFLAEVALRAAIMFVLVFATLRLMGKRAVKQLSVLELLIIISLGSAAGDPMLYREVGVLKAVTVFTVALLFYGIIMKLITRSEKMEKVLEGRPIYIIRDGRAAEESIEHSALAMDEFLATLRIRQIHHLGQIKAGVLETHGEVSLLLYDGNPKPGLPIWPDQLNKKTNRIPGDGLYACTFCGNTRHMSAGEQSECDYCHKTDEWVEAVTS